MITPYGSKIREHYLSCWRRKADVIRFDRGPIEDLPLDFRVLRFAPGPEREMWTYATQCMSELGDESRVELHLFAPAEHEALEDLLVATAHYHRTSARLNLGHTINFGQPWLPGSRCDHGLISLPYLDGPSLEWLKLGHGQTRFLWLIPITKDEVGFARKKGLQALESRFEQVRLNYLDPARDSVA